MKMDLREVGKKAYTGFIWLRLGRGWWALVNAVMNLRFP